MNILLTDVRATSSGSTTVEASSDVTLTCRPRSPLIMPETLTYSWHRVDGNIPSGSSGQNSARLTIHRIHPEDEGNYYCIARLFGHCAISNNVMVIVRGKKMISYAISVALYV